MATPRKPNPLPGGRPTLYKVEFVERARSLVDMGLSDSEIAQHFKVSGQTLTNWASVYPEFFVAMDRTTSVGIRTIKRSLFKRATGYRQRVVKHFILSGGKGDGSYIETRKVTEHVPADVKAAIAWLKVYDPEWRAASRNLDDPDIEKSNSALDKLIGRPDKIDE